MTRFEDSLFLVLGHEGGYSDHKADRGGKTNFGITQAVYDEWRISSGYGRQPIIGISAAEVRSIYLSRYWLFGKCDRLPEPLDYVHFDGCVNHGVGQAAKFLQRALGVVDDGSIGPVTLRAVEEESKAGNILLICEDILNQREDFYDHLANKDKSQMAFLRGWKNRIISIRERVA